jgi:hypothetical protein
MALKYNATLLKLVKWVAHQAANQQHPDSSSTDITTILWVFFLNTGRSLKMVYEKPKHVEAYKVFM